MGAGASKNNLTKSPAVGKDSSTKVSSPLNKDKKMTVTAENKDGTINL